MFTIVLDESLANFQISEKRNAVIEAWSQCVLRKYIEIYSYAKELYNGIRDLCLIFIRFTILYGYIFQLNATGVSIKFFLRKNLK